VNLFELLCNRLFQLLALISLLLILVVLVLNLSLQLLDLVTNISELISSQLQFSF